jgi:hypothetical protein
MGTRDFAAAIDPTDQTDRSDQSLRPAPLLQLGPASVSEPPFALSIHTFVDNSPVMADKMPNEAAMSTFPVRTKYGRSQIFFGDRPGI